MRCGRCKQLEVDVAHVRACYAAHYASRTEPERAAPPAGPPDGSVPGPVAAERRRPTPRRARSRDDKPWRDRMGPEEWAVEYAPQPTYWDAGVDADGGTPRLRRLEDEFGFEGMLYMWRSEDDDD